MAPGPGRGPQTRRESIQGTEGPKIQHPAAETAEEIGSPAEENQEVMEVIVSTVRLVAYSPRVWLLAFIVLMLVARCDDFSTYPKN